MRLDWQDMKTRRRICRIRKKCKYMNYGKDFSKWLQNQLRENNITQRELAYRTSLTEVTISRYIRGKRCTDYYTLVNIAKALNCNAIDFLTEESKSEMSIEKLITMLDIYANDTRLPVSECAEYYKAKLIVQKIVNNFGRSVSE